MLGYIMNAYCVWQRILYNNKKKSNISFIMEDDR